MTLYEEIKSHITSKEPMLYNSTEQLISEDAMKEIRKLLSYEDIILRGMPDIGYGWIETKGKYRGTFAKRLQKLAKEQNQVIPDHLLSQISDLAKMSLTNEPFLIYFTRDINWNPGEYGDDYSCFWASKRFAIKMLLENGAFAVLAHDIEDNPIARTWGTFYDFNKSESLILFNSYSKNHSRINLFKLRFILSKLLNLPHMATVQLSDRLRFNADSSMYINGGESFLLSEKKTDEVEKVILNWIDPGDEPVICSSCKDMIRGNQTGILMNEDIRCFDCLQDFAFCHIKRRWFKREYGLVMPDGNTASFEGAYPIFKENGQEYILYYGYVRYRQLILQMEDYFGIKEVLNVENHYA